MKQSAVSLPIVMRFVRRTLSAVVLLLAATTALRAQVVRGAVTERGSGSPLSGVVLSILDDQGRVAASALSNAEGFFDVRLPGAGRFTLEAKRIGLRKAQFAPFTIAAGDVRREDVVLDAIVFTLESVKVTGRSACVQRPQENEKTAALWEDARAALTATVLTQRTTNATDSVVRFMRKLDVNTWQVLFEQRHMVATSMDRPFRSLAADDLSEEGYVRMSADSTTVYYAPDAEVLMSDRFLADHCFRVQPGTGEHARQVGLAFEPIPTRKTPDVRGVLWLDARNGELQSLDFTFTWLPHDQRPGEYGGTVSFFRTPAGRWIVRSWRIRTPEFGYERWTEGHDGRRIALARGTTLRVIRIMEEGGAVPIRSLLSETGTVRGQVVLDTASHRPVAGITVMLAGTTAEAITDDNGEFALLWVPPGSYTVVLRHAALDSLGLEHLAATVDVGSGTLAKMELPFPSNAELAKRLCGETVTIDREAVVRLIVVDSTTGRPLPHALVRITHRGPENVNGAAGDSLTSLHEGRLDAQGSFVACGVPDRAMLRIEGRDPGAPEWSSTAQADAGTIGWMLVRVSGRTAP